MRIEMYPQFILVFGIGQNSVLGVLCYSFLNWIFYKLQIQTPLTAGKNESWEMKVVLK